MKQVWVWAVKIDWADGTSDLLEYTSHQKGGASEKLYKDINKEVEYSGYHGSLRYIEKNAYEVFIQKEDTKRT